MKLVFLVADGMGDWPLEELGGATPLQAAHTPNMDRLAREGVVGTCATVPEDMAPGSDVANMSLLGFEPAKWHTGRGPIEAAAMGLELAAEDLVYRLNLVTVSEFSHTGRMLDYSAGHIGTDPARILIEDLREHCLPKGFELFPGVQYRHILVQKGAAKSPEAALAVRPPHDITDQPIAPDFELLKQSPALWDFVSRAAERLEGSRNPTKANAVWPWGQGGVLRLPGFFETFGLRGAVVSAVDLVKGLGRAAGMEVIDVDGATGLLDTNYQGKVDAALSFLDRGDFVLVHLEGPDECGHGGLINDKIEAIARFDARIVGPILEALEGQDVAIMGACDHFTPIAVRTHTKDPVPFFLWGKGVPPGGATAFTEEIAAGTGLHIEQGRKLLPFALERLGLSGGGA
jgi:2,3-bisphosphoglycerate-independent phosphoglycerate mutase